MEPTNNADFWDQMYRRKHQHQHGHRHGHHGDGHGHGDGGPNPFLVQEAAGLAPGAALDVGCGEGADARWLAERGWRVTAIDFSAVALDHARAQDEGQQVTWVHGDLVAWQPEPSAFDLVTAHYLHLAPADRPAFFGRLAQAVRPGGALLFVAHHPSDAETAVNRPAIPDLYFTADEVAGWLAPGRWEVVVGGTRAAHGHDRDGHAVPIDDMVLHARRLA